MYLDLSNSLARACADTMMFFGCSSRRITSCTDVLRTACDAERLRRLTTQETCQSGTYRMICDLSMA